MERQASLKGHIHLNQHKENYQSEFYVHKC
jgi:hypothetical protein